MTTYVITRTAGTTVTRTTYASLRKAVRAQRHASMGPPWSP